MAEPVTHPIRLIISDDLARSRLTVFFRLLLAIPHFIWIVLWGIAAFLVAFLNWFATLFMGRSPAAFHNFLAAYLRYTTHVSAFIYLAANPFPGFSGAAGSYPVDLEVDPPARQSRWATGFRFLLAIPALILSSVLAGGGGGWGGGWANYGLSGGVAGFVAFFGWFVCLARARMPRGFRDVAAYSIGYGSRVTGYLYLLTDRYPSSDPASYPIVAESSDHPIRLTRDDDLRRSRLTVFFRLLLALPHLVWLSLWSIAAFVAGLANGVATLLAGRSPDALHRFLGAFVRYQAHVNAFVWLVANPFPGFTGRPAAYPVDLVIGPSEPQNRWITFFRIVLALPAFLIAAGFSMVLFVVGFLGWFSGLFRGQMPRGLGNLGAFALRYYAQTSGYFYVLTDRYPYTGPTMSELGQPAPAIPSEPPRADPDQPNP